MNQLFTLTRWALPVCLLPAFIGTGLAQVPTITGFVPQANARAAARSGPVSVSFSQPLTAASASALKVFSPQRGGLRTVAAPALVNANTLSFTPPYPFRPGETVQATVTTGAAAAGGALAAARVVQFTTAVGGTGTGTFQLGSNPTVGGNADAVALGDVDGDGDLDLLATTGSNTVGIRFNDGLGGFAGGLSVAVGLNPQSIVLGDVDGDGDLDLLTGNGNTTTVSVRLNNGSGTYGGGQEVVVGSFPRGLALGDVDGDGDLDLLAANSVGGPGTVSLRLNNGAGTFSGTTEVSVGSYPYDVALGDLDGDGDLDLVTANADFNQSGTASVRFNNGSGVFSGTMAVSVGTEPYSVALGDVDGDNDLDLVVANHTTSGTVATSLNAGNGSFSRLPTYVTAGAFPVVVKLGDVDHDGDLDVVAANLNSSTASVRFNNGSGTFTSGTNAAVGNFTSHLVLGDVDNDGDLDLVTATDVNAGVRLNGGTGPLAARPPASGGGLFPNPATAATALVGCRPGAAVQVFDAVGRVVATTTANAAGTAPLAALVGLLPGLYVVRAEGQVWPLVVE